MRLILLNDILFVPVDQKGAELFLDRARISEPVIFIGSPSCEKLGKRSLLVGRLAQEHALHAHEGMDKVYHVLEGSGLFVLEDRELPMEAGVMLVAPEGVPHGIRNSSEGRLLVMAILAPAPG